MQPTSAPDATRPDPLVERHLVPLRARAWWGSELVAESDAAVRVEEEGQPPALYFPLADVRFELFEDEGRRATCPVKGSARLWSIGAADGSTTLPGSARPDDWTEPDDWTAPGEPGAKEPGAQEPGADGRDVLWSFTQPCPGLAGLEDHATFDHDRVRVEVVDGDPQADPRDVTTKRFPTWGDASDLVDLLDVRLQDEHRYVSATKADWRRPVVEGSQMLGQAIVAAGRESGGRRPVSAHMVFLRAADANRPLAFHLDQVSNGRTFTTTTVRVTQDDRCCATGTLLLDETAPDLIRHEVPPPEVAGPYDSPAYDMSVTGRDLRIVDGAYTGDPDAPIGLPRLDAWVRFRDVPDDPCLHAGLLAQFTGHLAIAAALRPHAGVGQQQAHRSLSTAINAIGISFHAHVRADRWLLYRHRSTFAGDGMTHAECRVHDEDGALIASFTVDAMVRPFAAGTGERDDRTAM